MKIYKQPTTNVVSIELQTMMAGSKLANPEEGFNPNDAPETLETSGNLSRRNNVWDDDDEEEDY